MSGRDWDKEMAKIDKQLSSMSDDDLAARSSPPPAGARAAAPAAREPGAAPSRLGVILRVGLAVALSIGLLFWPYAARCGFGLAGYLASVAVVVAAGSWAGIATWKARAGRMHILSLAVVAWGIALAAVETLPRIGYAKDPARVTWMCR
jgi:hypothetical protein